MFFACFGYIYCYITYMKDEDLAALIDNIVFICLLIFIFIVACCGVDKLIDLFAG